MSPNEDPMSRVQITACVQCGTPFCEAKLGSMSKFLGWRLGSQILRSDGQLYVTLLEGRVRVNFLLRAGEFGLDAKLIGASIPLNVGQAMLDKLRCFSCCAPTPLGDSSCAAPGWA